jgi:hypothetical protein
LFYAGFVVVKIASASIMKGQVKTNIIDKMGFVRGPDFTVEMGVKIVEEVLKAEGLLEEEYEGEEEDDYGDDRDTEASSDDYKGQRIVVNIDQKRSMILFNVTYRYVIDFIFFKQEKIYQVEGEVQNYN